MVKRVGFVVPGDLSTLTGGYGYDRRIIAGLQVRGWTVDIINPGEGYPWPNARTIEAANESMATLESGCPVIMDGLALGVMPEAVARIRRDHPLIALIHHPLALESGLTEAQSRLLFTSERQALEHVDHIVVTSSTTAQCLRTDFGVTPYRLSVICPGTEPAPASTGSTDGVVRLVSVGSIVPRKGFDVLVAALATLREQPWTLAIAGDESRDVLTAQQLRADIDRFHLRDKITLLGSMPPDKLENLYATSDIFVLASRYEGYGMAFAEAIAHGLPVIGTTGGAIPDTVPPEAGLLAEPGDVDTLARALRQLIENPDHRHRLAMGARLVAQRLPAWADAADAFSGVIEQTIHSRQCTPPEHNSRLG